MERPLQKANIKNDLNPILKTKIQFFWLQLSSAHSWCFEASSVFKKGKEPITLRTHVKTLVTGLSQTSLFLEAFFKSIRFYANGTLFDMFLKQLLLILQLYIDIWKKCHQDLKFQMIRFMFFFSGLFLILPWNANISFGFQCHDSYTLFSGKYLERSHGPLRDTPWTLLPNTSDA